MAKLLRVIRLVRMFRELRLMMSSIFGSLKSLFWAIIVIIAISFVLGVFFLQMLTQYVESEKDKGESWDAKRFADIEKHWGSLEKSIVTLYASCTGGVSWIELVEELGSTERLLYWLFLLYVAFFMFVIANTLTSLLLESTIQNATRDQQSVMQDAIAKKEQYIRQIEGIFKHLDSDKSSEVSIEEVRQHLTDPQMIAFMSNLEIDYSDVEDFFAILTSGGGSGVDIDTFVSGCMKLRGQARSVDLVSLIVQHKRAWKEHQQLARSVQDQHGDIRNILGEISQALGLASREPKEENYVDETETIQRPLFARRQDRRRGIVRTEAILPEVFQGG
jgi:hypothetical protein